VLQKFVGLIEHFVHRRISVEEFIDRYLRLRDQVLVEAYSDSRYRSEISSLYEGFHSGEIDPEQFDTKYWEISHKYWPEKYKDIDPIAEGSKLLLGRLMVAVDAFEAPGFEDLKVEEGDLRQIAADTLETIRGTMQDRD
jgi:hypothetical protein